MFTGIALAGLTFYFVYEYQQQKKALELQTEKIEKADQIAWQNAQNANTADAYDEYIRLHPDGR